MLRNFPLKNQFLLQNQLQVRLDCGSGTPIIGKVNLDVTEPVSSAFDPETINERLGEGDLTALEVLDKFKIAYTQEEKNGKTIIKYEYNGTKYTINCYPPDDTEAAEPIGDTNVPDAGNTDETNGPFGSYWDLFCYTYNGEECKQAVLEKLGITEEEFETKYGQQLEFVQLKVAQNHEEDFATVTREQIINEIVAEYNSKVAQQEGVEDTAPSEEAGDFASYNDLRNFMFGNECRSLVREQGITDFSHGFAYENIADIVSKKHTEDFANITKEQLLEEYVAEYNARVSENDSAVENNGQAETEETDLNTKFKSYGELVLYMNEEEFQTAVLEKLGITLEEFEKQCKTTFGVVSSSVRNTHSGDFASVTKAQLIDEVVAAYNNRVITANPEAKVDEYIDVWVNDFKTGYTRWGLTTAPTDDEIALFKSKLQEECDKNINTLRNVTSEEDIKQWVRKQCDNVITVIKNARADVESDANAKNAAGVISGIISTVKNRDLSTIISGQSTIHTEFGMDAYGNIVFQDSKTKQVFDYLYESVKKRILETENGAEVLRQLGGEDVLKKLIQSAWIANYADFDSSQKNTATNFVYGVLNKLSAMMAKIQANPDNLELYTARSSYADTTLTDNLIHYNAKTTYGGDEEINYKGTVTTDSDGTVHIANKNDDPDYQTTMKALLQRLKEKYPNVDEAVLTKIFQAAQKEALSILQSNANDCPYGTGNNSGRVEDGVKNWSGKDNRKDDDYRIHMDELVQITLYCFDKQFINGINDGTVSAQEVETDSVDNNKTTTPSDDPVKTIAEDIEAIIPEVQNKDLAKIIGNHSVLHTEFGMNSSGSIVFQESETSLVFTYICSYVQSELLEVCKSSDYSKFGGYTVIRQLVQAAWITAYNSFNSSQKNNAAAFVTEVLNNLQKMMAKIQENPELLSVFTQRTSYADTSLTDGLIHYNTNTTYGGDEKISTSGTVTTDSSGKIHIANKNDDNDYQFTMDALLERLIEKYSSIDANTVTTVFRDAQKKALAALKNGTTDCPYGTGNNGQRVEDSSKDWGGKDSRSGDGGTIHMDQIVQMTLYYFDKLIYQKLIS